MRRAVLGNGIYTFHEAARLLGMQAGNLRAWFRGWPRRPQAIFLSDYAALDAAMSISFLDFIEAAVAATLHRRHRVSIQMIRRLRERLQQEWSTEHPFGREEFYTDDSGRQIFCTLSVEDGDRSFVEILKRQYAMPEILLPFLKKVEYNALTKFAQAISLTDSVVLDPRKKYGKPIIRGTGMPTSILAACFHASQSYESVADWYGVTPENVEAAVEFEASFPGIAA